MRSSRWVTGVVGLAVLAAPATVQASSGIDRSLGNGLGRLLGQQHRTFKAAGTGPVFNQELLTIRDAAGRVLVDLTAAQGANLAAFRDRAEAAGLKVTAVDRRRGTLEGFVAVGKVRGLAGLKGTGTLVQALKPHFNVGSVTSQGVPIQRIDRAQDLGLDGSGITVGALSDSFDTATQGLDGHPIRTHYTQDVKLRDLPGRSNPNNREPVVVLQDSFGADEGRAMLQIVHDVAPKAKLCFATAFEGGQVGFAQNILALADQSGPCGADVVVDDVSYFDEPMFSDGVIADAANQVVADGGHYFSSANNSGDRQAYADTARLVSPAKAAQSTDLDFGSVPPELYSGGVQDFDAGAATDLATTVNFQGSGILDFQWDDPYDPNGPKLGAPLLEETGELSAPGEQDVYEFDSTGHVGDTVRFFADGIPSGSTDLVLTVLDPDGDVIDSVDTGTSPEFLVTKLDQAGTYTIVVEGFDGDTGGYTLDVREVESPTKTSTDYNLLFFLPDGTYIGSQAEINPLSGRASEIIGLDYVGDLQVAITKAGTTGRAKRLRIVNFDNATFSEHVDSLAPATFGHAVAKDAIAVGAYDPFTPFLRETYTAPGGNLQVFFDSQGNRLPSSEVLRRKPEISSVDRGNTTFFTADSPLDPDEIPNFGGTSASAPHAAGIAALMLQSDGGPGSISHAQMVSRLERSAFPHDLDPDQASGAASGLSVLAKGGQGDERFAPPGGLDDPRFFTVRYTGSVPLTSIEFNGDTANPTGLGRGGIVFDPRPFAGSDAGSFLHSGFPFTVGGTGGGLQPGDVTATFSRNGGFEPGTYRTMTLQFANGLRRGQSLQFGIDRDERESGYGGSSTGNGADVLGDAVSLPSGQVVRGGLTFIGHRANGTSFVGQLHNRIGKGFTPADGYGVVNAEAAVQ